MNEDDLIIDAFAGAGGWDEGARRSGFQGRILGIELDHAACHTGVAAGHWRVRADVATFPLAHLRGRVAGCVLSPPCPTWSTAGDGAGKVDLPNVLRLIADYAAGREPGEYRWEDARSALTAQPMRYAVELEPQWIALEQVPPVLPIWQYTADRLRGLGYKTWCGILSAEEYGVPQTRKRAVLVAALDGPVGPPAPTHQAYVSGQTLQLHDDLFGPPLPPPVSMAEALGWGRPSPSHTLTNSIGRGLAGGSGARKAMRDELGRGEWVMRSNYGTGGDPQDRGERSADEPAPTVTSKIDRNVVVWTGVNSRQAGGTTKIFERAIADPSPTLTGNVSRWQVRELEVPRADSIRVTVHEAGVLQGFRPDYPWQGTKTQQYLQVGNAIPVGLAAAVLRPLLASSATSGEVAA